MPRTVVRSCLRAWCKWNNVKLAFCRRGVIDLNDDGKCKNFEKKGAKNIFDDFHESREA